MISDIKFLQSNSILNSQEKRAFESGCEFPPIKRRIFKQVIIPILMGIRQGNYIQNLVNYMKKNLSKGYTLDSLKISLMRQGYTKTEIDKVVEQTHIQLAAEAPKVKEKPFIKYELVDENDRAIEVKPRKSWWKRLFG
jgi:hypothetical protein